jgi:hypothetical protein
LDLSIFTGVDNTTSGNPISFSLEQNYPNSFENETNFELCMSQAGTVTIYLQNSLGEIITSFSHYLPEGKHQFQLDGSGLAIGPYFISAMANGEMKAIKIMKIGNSSGDKVEINYIGSGFNPGMIIIPGDAFDFIGYAKGSKRDTIKSVVPKGGENYEFEYEILSDWNFSSMVLEIGGFKAVYKKRHNARFGDGTRQDYTYFDTVNLKNTYELRSRNSYTNECMDDNYYCGNFHFIEDTIRFCQCYLTSPATYWLQFETVIDTTIKEFKNIFYLENADGDNQVGINWIKVKYKMNIKINDSRYDIDKDGNYIVNLNGNIDKVLNEFYYSFFSSTDSGSNMLEEYSDLISYYGFSDSSYIRITLKP